MFFVNSFKVNLNLLLKDLKACKDFIHWVISLQSFVAEIVIQSQFKSVQGIWVKMHCSKENLLSFSVEQLRVESNIHVYLSQKRAQHVPFSQELVWQWNLNFHSLDDANASGTEDLMCSDRYSSRWADKLQYIFITDALNTVLKYYTLSISVIWEVYTLDVHKVSVEVIKVIKAQLSQSPWSLSEKWLKWLRQSRLNHLNYLNQCDH